MTTHPARPATAEARAVAGTGTMVVVLGEPGIGQTRLLEELAARARGRDIPVAWVRCPERGDGRANSDAVAEGLATTAQVITAAAIMVVVFGAFVLNDELVTKLAGLGLTTAVGA